MKCGIVMKHVTQGRRHSVVEGEGEMANSPPEDPSWTVLCQEKLNNQEKMKHIFQISFAKPPENTFQIN